MANTFLNTGSVVATSNPQANIEQVNNAATQPVQNNNSQNSASGISPITIPIQIQPQIATASTQPITGTNNIQNLQTNTNQASSAPTPQTYNPTNTNTNVVDFNQIYKSYQSAYGNNKTANTNIGQSGIKKTSIGTTIVTPTTSNLNSVQGQYQSAYSDTINSLISEMLTQMNGGFTYDPTKDSSLKVATEYASNSTLQSLAGSGVLNSTATAERVARIVSELIPTYEEKAHDRWLEYVGQLADTAQVVMSYDAQQFEYWKDLKDREFQEKEFEYQKKQNELENAWKRVDELGYVDNEASAILGVKVGTLSGTARLAKEEREFELQKMREQAQIEYANQVALYKVKSDLEKEYAKYEYDLVKTYGSKSSSSSSNYETYDEIIKNRYAEYDSVSHQYVIPNEKTYNEYMDFLDLLLASNSITDEEFLKLGQKYSKYNGQELSNTSSTVTTATEAGLNSNNLSTWIKALDGNNSALNELGVNIWGQKKSNVNNSDAKDAVNEALRQIKDGEYTYTSNQQLMNDLKNGKFGHLGWGL